MCLDASGRAARANPGWRVTPTASIGTDAPSPVSPCSLRAAAPYCTPSWPMGSPRRSWSPTGPAGRSTSPPSTGCPASSSSAPSGGRASTGPPTGSSWSRSCGRTASTRRHGRLRHGRPGPAGGVRRAGCSTPTRRCCPPSRAGTRCATRWRYGVKVTGSTVHLATERGRRRADPGPGGRARAARRHRGDAARAHQAGRAAALPRHHPPVPRRARGERRSSEGPALGLRQVRHRRARPRAGRPRVSTWCRRAAPRPRCATPAWR